PQIHVVAGAAGGAINDAVAAVRPHHAGVARFAVGEQRGLTARQVVAVELEKLVAAAVLGIDERFAGGGLELAAGDAVREKRELRARSAGELHIVDLRGIGKSRADEHLAARGMPAAEAGAADLRVGPNFVGHRRGYGPYAFDNQVISRSDGEFSGLGVLREQPGGGHQYERERQLQAAWHGTVTSVWCSERVIVRGWARGSARSSSRREGLNPVISPRRSPPWGCPIPSTRPVCA